MWRVGGPFEIVERHYQTARGHVGASGADWTRHALQDAQLFYLTAEAIEQLLGLYRTWPNDGTISAGDGPARSGLVLLERSIYGADSERPGHDVAVDALLWSPLPTSVRPAGIGIASYWKVSLPTHDEHDWNAACGIVSLMTGRPAVRDDAHGDLFLPLGRTDWAWGAAADADHGPRSVQVSASLTEDRCLLASLWKLLDFNVLSTDAIALPRAAQRRSHRNGGRHREVRVVTWKPDGSHRRAGDHGDGEPGGQRRWNSRWVVRGHFRNQAYGPGRAERKVIFVDSFIKGPDEAPLRNPGKVFRVTRRDVEVPR